MVVDTGQEFLVQKILFELSKTQNCARLECHKTRRITLVKIGDHMIGKRHIERGIEKILIRQLSYLDATDTLSQ